MEGRMAEKPFLLRAGFDESEIAFMYEAMARDWGFAGFAPVLCHGDFLPEHVFFDKSLNVTGVIDFGWYEGEHPMRDFLSAAIDYGEREVGFLREGYGPGGSCWMTVLTFVCTYRLSRFISGYWLMPCRPRNHRPPIHPFAGSKRL